MSDRRPKPWLAIALTVVVLGIGITLFVRDRQAASGVNRQAVSLRAAVVESFRDTTLEQVNGLNRAAVSLGDPNGDLSRFLRRPGQKPLVFLRLGQTFVARYGAEADGHRRTVEVTWSAAGVSVRVT